jgi:4-amino-4-deoxy-L-arabinose transferase-like glycosyltransferase
MNHANRERLLLLAVWLAVVLSALLTRPLLPVDETRYAAVAWEMWTRSDFLVPHLNGEPYSHKPPLFFWLVHAGWWLTGVNEWVVRLLPTLLALLILPLGVRVAGQLWPEDRQAQAAMPWVLTGCIVFPAFATWVQLDLLLVLCTLLAMSGVLDASRGRRTGWLLAGAGIGLGVLAKGPVILLHVLPVALLAPLWLRAPPAGGWQSWYAGLLVSVISAATLALAWAIPAALLGGESYRDAIFWGQTANRLVESFAHAHPPWWYLPWLAVLFAPWCFLPWLWRALLQSRPMADAGLRFCLTWLLPVFILLSLVSGKQLKYLLPLLPAFALLLARVLSMLQQDPVTQRPWLLATVLLLLGVLGMVLPLSLDQAAWIREVSPVWGGLLLVMAVILLRLRSLRPLQYPRLLSLLAAAVLVVAHAGVFRIAAPAYDLQAASESVAAAQAAGRQVVALMNYHGEFGFYGRLTQPVQQLDSAEALAWAGLHPGDYLVTRGRQVADMQLEAEFLQPYRGGYLAIVDGRTLLQNPGLLP